MTIVVLLALILGTGVLAGYVRNFQNTISALGGLMQDALAGPDISGGRNVLQSAITPQGHTIRSYVTAGLHGAIVVYGWVAFAWWVGLASLLLALTLTVLLSNLFPKPMSLYYVAPIISGLASRHSGYRKSGDQERADAAKYMMDLLDRALEGSLGASQEEVSKQAESEEDNAKAAPAQSDGRSNPTTAEIVAAPERGWNPTISLQELNSILINTDMTDDSQILALAQAAPHLVKAVEENDRQRVARAKVEYIASLWRARDQLMVKPEDHVDPKMAAVFSSLAAALDGLIPRVEAGDDPEAQAKIDEMMHVLGSINQEDCE